MKESNALRIAKRYISDAIGAGAIKRKLKKVLMMKVLQKEPEIDYPELRPGDLENAKLFANQENS
jgi:hypothetical protein